MRINQLLLVDDVLSYNYCTLCIYAQRGQWILLSIFEAWVQTALNLYSELVSVTKGKQKVTSEPVHDAIKNDNDANSKASKSH